ncbi:MAG: hypothetical protein WD766_10960 [Gemmatimonadota bacterium]
MSRPSVFWTSSMLVALTFAGLSSLLMPYEALGIDTGPDRQQTWLLTLWTSGVMAICFGVAGLLTNISPLGFRDVHDSGSVTAALDARREESQRQRASGIYNFAGWTIVTGAALILVYFGAWWSIGR